MADMPSKQISLEALRGSTKLQDEWFQRRTDLDRSDISAILELADARGTKLVGWHKKGQPPRIDMVQAVYQIEPKALSQFVERYAGLEREFTLDVFPLGIPFPDIYRVVLQSYVNPLDEVAGGLGLNTGFGQ